MKYELAKKLKDAGFPQKGKERYFLDKSKLPKKDDFGNDLEEEDYIDDEVDECEVGIKGINTIDEFIAIPTLSELIEACGEKIRGVMKDGDYWLAFTGYSPEEEKGKTPEIAVANLWLKLNEK